MKFLKTISLITFAALCIAAPSKKAHSEPTIDTNFEQYIIDRDELGKAEKITFGKSRKASPDKVYTTQQERGVIQTGLTPLFDKAVTCRPIDSEIWAKDYTRKRGKPAHHKGIDIPAPRGTAILAVADGTVVGKFLNKKNPKGIEIVLRHEPEDTGLPMWTYSQYTHLLAMPELPIGARVKMGEEIGKTSNTGISGREARRKNTGKSRKGRGRGKVRRDALHFAIFYSNSPKYSTSRKGIIPLDGYFMDPNAFYRKNAPFDSPSMKNLPATEKQIPTPYMTDDGQFVPQETKVIWPYACSAK